jgi:hypothetical protein
MLWPPSKLKLATLVAAGTCAVMTIACAEPKAPSQATVGLRFDGAPDSALVVIDDVAVGTLADVKARGVRVREGRHRISSESIGYFPSDQFVEAAGDLLKVQIVLQKLPE